MNCCCHRRRAKARWLVRAYRGARSPINVPVGPKEVQKASAGTSGGHRTVWKRKRGGAERGRHRWEMTRHRWETSPNQVAEGGGPEKNSQRHNNTANKSQISTTTWAGKFSFLGCFCPWHHTSLCLCWHFWEQKAAQKSCKLVSFWAANSIKLWKRWEKRSTARGSQSRSRSLVQSRSKQAHLSRLQRGEKH